MLWVIGYRLEAKGERLEVKVESQKLKDYAKKYT